MTPFPIALESSIDTSTPDYDISPFNPEEGKAPHTKNNGIERNGGIKNAYYKKYTKTAGMAVQYTKSGKRVEVDMSVAGAGKVYVDGVWIGQWSNLLSSVYNVAFPYDCEDCIPVYPYSTATNNQYDVLRMTSPGAYSIQRWQYTPSTKAWALINAIALGAVFNGRAFSTRKIVRGSVSYTTLTDCEILGQFANLTLARVDGDGTLIDLPPSATFTTLGQFSAWKTSGDADCIVVRMDQPYTYVSATATTYTDYGYGICPPQAAACVAPYDATVTVYRQPTTNKTVGKIIDIKTGAEADIDLTYTPTAIHYSIVTLGGIFVSYAHAAGDATEIVKGSTLTNVSTVRSYATEAVGHIPTAASGGFMGSQPIGIYTVNHIASYIGGGVENGDLGALISEVGALDPGYSPFIAGDNLVYKTVNGLYMCSGYTTGSNDSLLSLIDDEAVLINSVTGKNLIDARIRTLGYGPTAWNNSYLINVPYASPGVPMTIAAVADLGEYGQSVDVGEKALVNVGSLAALHWVAYTGYGGLGVYGAIKIPIKIYENSVYSFTGFAGGASYITGKNDTRYSGSVYVQSLEVPFPVSTVIAELSGYAYLKTYFRRDKKIAYTIGNEVPYAGITFSLFGTKYLFDYEDLFIISFNAGGLLQSVEKVAIASGLTFLCATPIEAWFLSLWDNSLWTFNGGKNVEKVLRCNAKDAILGGAYCGAANEVIFYEGSGKALYLRDGIMTESTLPVTAAGALSLQPDINGTWIVPQSGAGDICQLVHNSTGATILPLDFQTAYQGPGLARKTTVEEYVLTLYDPAKTAGVVTLEFNGFDEAGAHTVETHNITVTALYDAGGYLRLSCVPIAGQVIGGSLRVYTTLPVTIIDATARIGDNLAATVYRNR